MKKIAFIVALCMGSLFVLADSIMWMINTGVTLYDDTGNIIDPYYTDYNAARIIATDTFGQRMAILPSVYFNEDTWAYDLEFADGVGLLDDGSTGEMWSVIKGPGISNDGVTPPPTDIRYAIELGNAVINEDTWEVDWLETHAITKYLYDATIAGNYKYIREIDTSKLYPGYGSSGGTLASNVYGDGWNPTVFQVIPEPSSMALILIGISGILFKRKTV